MNADNYDRIYQLQKDLEQTKSSLLQELDYWKGVCKIKEEENKTLQVLLARKKEKELTAEDLGVQQELHHLQDTLALKTKQVFDFEEKIKGWPAQIEELKHKLIEQAEQSKKIFLQKEKEIRAEVENKKQELAADYLRLERENENKYRQSLEELARGFVHRLRNYLAVISGVVQICLGKIGPDQRFRYFKYLFFRKELEKRLSTALEHVDGSIQTIEEYDRFSQSLIYTPQPSSVKEIIEKAIQPLQERCQHQKVYLVKEFSPALPVIVVDPLLLERAFFNLVLNSLESMPEGGAVVIRTGVKVETRQLYIKFIDNGSGMPAHYLKKIFQPFFSTKPQSQGLGLARARRIIDLHKGKMEVESERGKGTVLTVLLPLGSPR